jgi:hypothetical protein
MKRISYFFPRQLCLFTTGFYFTQVVLSGRFARVSGIAWGISLVWLLGVFIWNTRIQYKKEIDP